MASGAEPKIDLAGSSALLLDAAEGRFSPDVQRRVWALAAAAKRLGCVRDAVPGMNNLLVAFDPLAMAPEDLRGHLRRMWRDVEPGAVVGKTVEILVHYGGPNGEDLLEWADHCGLPVAEAVRRHAAADYSVAAIGAMPGFPYLSGLDPALGRPRRASPRASIPEGAVIIGGSQAGIMPQPGPSGWHVLGVTAVKLFDPFAEPPALLQPGDIVRFVVAGIEA